MSDENVKDTAVGDDRRVVLRAAGVVGVAFLFSRIVGLARDIVIKFYLGLTPAATAFDAAQRFPESIFLIIAGGAVGAAFIPTFSAYFEREDEAGAWRLFSAVINLATVAVTVTAVVVFIFAEQFVTFFLSQLVAEQPELLPLTVQLMRVMLLSTIIFGASGVVMAALNARQHFLLPALAPIIYNLGIIAGGLLWPGSGPEKVMGFAVGTAIGALGHLLIQLPALRRKQAHYRPIFTLRDPGVIQVLRLMAPRVLGLSFSEINKFVTLYLAGLMPPASYPALTLAWRIMIMPLGIIGQAMGIAAFPTMASLVARNALPEMRRIVADSLRMLLFFGLPAAVLLMGLGGPLITLLFERGVFAPEDTELVATALFFYALGLVALTWLEVIARAFYSLNDTLTPVLAGGAQIFFMTLLSLWLSQVVFPQNGLRALGGLALGHSISNFLEVGLLLWLLQRKLGGVNGRTLWDGIWRMGLAGGVMGAVMWLLLPPLAALGALGQLVIGGVVGGVVYLSVSLVLRVSELTQLIGIVRRRVRR